MRKRLVTLVAALTAMTVLGAGAAFAFAPETDRHIDGAGRLLAVGSGDAVLDGRGIVRMVISGDVTIQDTAGDLSVRLQSLDGTRGDAQPDTTITLENYQGALVVVGSGFVIQAEGNMVIAGRGNGTVTLTGTGFYKTRHDSGFWLPEGLSIRIGEVDTEL